MRNSKISLQIISDIHLEFISQKITMEYVKNLLYYNTGDNARDLCLLGDIGYPSSKKYKTFLSCCSKLYEDIF